MKVHATSPGKAQYELCWQRALRELKALRAAASKTMGCRRYEAVGCYIELMIGELKDKLERRRH
jgi:hypothetical protein